MSFDAQAFIEGVQALQLPTPDMETLDAIVQAEGADMLMSALQAAREGKKRALTYLQGILYVVTPATRSRLSRRGLPPLPLVALIEIGKAEGPTFSTKLRTWDAEGGQDGDDARYLRLTIARQLENSRLKPVPPTSQPGQGQRSSSAAGGSGPSTNENPRQWPREATEDTGPSNPVEDVGSSPEARKDDREFISQHIYGGKAAACFSADKTRGDVHTVRIEAAEVRPGGQQRDYDWKGKVSIQLSNRELPLVLATLMRWITKFEGKGHGASNEKWFTLENQAGKIYLSVNAKGRSPRGIPILPGDAYSITTLIIRQMLKNDPFLSSEALLAITKKQAEILLAA